MTTALSSSFQQSAKSSSRRRAPVNRPFSIRLSAVERRRLESEAGLQPLGTYVRARLLDNAARRRTSAPAADRIVLSQILGKLGRLQLSANLSDLAQAAKVGSVALTPDLECAVSSACHDLRDMRAMLMRTLGIKPEARA